VTALPVRRRTTKISLARREARQGLLFLSPWIIGFVAFTAIPMLATLGFSFTNLNLSQEEPLRLIGLENYADLARDSQVWQSLGITLRFAVLWLPVVIVVPLAIALLLNSASIRGAATLRVLFFLPYVVPFVAGVLIWQTMLGETGWINGVLSLLGVDNPPSWLFDTSWIYPGLVIMGLWGIGAGIVVNTAGLQGIPTELYDAAKIDGAGWWAQLRYVTLPMMSPVIFYTLTLGIVEVMQYFLVPLVINNGTGEPGGSTLFYNLYLYKTFFTFQQMGYGAAMAWLLFLVILMLTLVIFRWSRRWVFYAGVR
jgi:multiple sugar transport system permease protein